MADKDELKLEIEEEGSEEPTEATTDMNEVPEPPAEPIAPAKSGSATRLLLLVLLLVVLGAAAWFLYFAPQMETASAPSTSAPDAPKKQAVPVPSRDAAPSMEAAAKHAEKPAAVADKPDADKVTAQKPAPAKTGGRAETYGDMAAAEPAATATAQNREAAAGAEPLPSAKPVPARPTADTASAQPAEKEIPGQEIPVVPVAPVVESKPAAVAKPRASAPASAPTKGAYQVQVGAYAVAANMVEAQDKIRELGFESHVKEARRTTNMVRLRVGTFFPSQGEAKIAEVAEAGGEPFYIKDRVLMVVYAGSFQSPERAQVLTERLREKGVHVEPETVPTQVPLSILRFGNFSSRSEAESAAAKARAAGLDTLIVKTR